MTHLGPYRDAMPMHRLIENEGKILENILKSRRVSDDNRREAMSIYKELAYQWCSSNAYLCALVEIIMEKYPDLNLNDLHMQIMTGETYERTIRRKPERQRGGRLPWDDA